MQGSVVKNNHKESILHDVRETSVIIPVRGLKKEIKFMNRSIPSLSYLGSAEIIFLIDDPPHPDRLDLKKIIASKCDRFGIKTYKIISIKHNKSFKMQLCNVFLEGCKRAQYDKILFLTIDTVINQNAAKGCEYIGKDGVAIYGFHYEPHVAWKGWYPGHRIRLHYHRRGMKEGCYGRTGLFWFYRPYFMECVRELKLREIANGVDTITYDEIENSKYKIIIDPTISGRSLEIENPDLGWRQFLAGIHFFETSPHLYPLFWAILHTWRPKMLLGYVWAWRHPNHPAVEKIRSMGNDYTYAGAYIYTMIYPNWKGDQSAGSSHTP